MKEARHKRLQTVWFIWNSRKDKSVARERSTVACGKGQEGIWGVIKIFWKWKYSKFFISDTNKVIVSLASDVDISDLYIENECILVNNNYIS